QRPSRAVGPGHRTSYRGVGDVILRTVLSPYRAEAMSNRPPSPALTGAQAATGRVATTAPGPTTRAAPSVRSEVRESSRPIHQNSTPREMTMSGLARAGRWSAEATAAAATLA